jgi:hypothetical protein
VNYSFDDLDANSSNNSLNLKPIWALENPSPDDIHKWLISELTEMQQDSKDRINEVKKNIALYKGIHYYSQDSRTSNRDTVDTASKYKQKVVVNHLFDFTEQKLSRAVKFKPNISVVPIADTSEDRYSAKITKQFYDQVSEVENLDDKDQDAIRKALITGETFSFCEWDENKGMTFPVVAELKALGKEVEEISIGDISIKNYLPHKVFLEQAESLEQVKFLFKEDIEETELLKRKYPEVANKLKPENRNYFSITKLEDVKLTRHSIVWTFYHKKTKEFPTGAQYKFTKDTMLEILPLPYEHGMIPCARLTEIQIPGELNGRSFYTHAGPLQAHINNLTSMAMRNQYMAAHPKWMVPHGSVKLESLGNDLTIVQYRGAQPPVLSQANPTSPETYNLRKMLIDEAGQISGVFGVSRGEPPPGIKAGVALQFLSEQENERLNAFLANISEYRKTLAKLIIKTAAQFYTNDDQRKMKIVGKGQEHTTEFIDVKHLQKDYDIRVQNTASLPKSIAARTQYILDISQTYPNLFTPEQVIDMLDLANDERMKTESTSAVRHAEDSFEALCEGKPYPEPQEYEDHIIWWKIFYAKIQEFAFKRMPDETRATVLAHLNAREMLMFDKAQKNPLFAQQLSQLPNFPVLFEPEVSQMPMTASDAGLPDVVSQLGMMPPELGQQPIPQGV